MDPNELYPNTTQYPNWLMDQAMCLLSGTEWKVLSYIVRHTYGWRKTADAISVSQICDGNGKTDDDGHLVERGTGLSRKTVVTALKVLYDYGGLLIREERAGREPVYQINLHPKPEQIAWLERRFEDGAEASEQRTRSARASREIAEETPTPIAVQPIPFDNPGCGTTQVVGQPDTHVVGHPPQKLKETHIPDPIRMGSGEGQALPAPADPSPSSSALPEPEKTFLCPKCGQGAKSRAGLANHMRAAHGEQGIYPAIAVYRAITKWLPLPGIREQIMLAVGNVPDNVERWRQVVMAYCGLGWNPRNVKAMLEFYGRGEIPTTKQNGGEKHERQRSDTKRQGGAPESVYSEELRKRWGGGPPAT